MHKESSVFGPEEQGGGEGQNSGATTHSAYIEVIQTSLGRENHDLAALGADSVPQPAFSSTSNAGIASGSEAAAQEVTSVRPQDTDEEDDDEREFIDEFGFIIDREQKDRELLYVKNIDGKKVVRREVKWANMASDWDKVNSKRHALLKERCRKGIPARFRGVAWQLLLGSHKQMLDPAIRGTYASLYNKELADEELAQVIERDLARTFPTHILFREEGGVGQTFLRNVLHAYACIDPEVGYVQGMGFVVGALSTQMEEEETFWALHTLMYDSRYTLREMYRPGFPMLQQFFYQLSQLMARLLPKLYSHFESVGMHPSFYASQWFMTLFVYHFPFRALLRVWDIFMSEGWKIIFRVAIALMKWEEKRLVKMPFDEAIPALKKMHEGKDPDEILRRAQAVKFKTSELQAYSDAYWRMQNTM
ncbi:rab-like GTPase activating protein [Trypanosoma rangeli]|uniref:Rab-like GTPase activating protein n=1 Tax=Trypanosoma rangeli TaxID=5698 RepID=A0A422NJ84_TRYRA|nr:rab-like GTPase activating protein [Trypanosoma rangeli]RNF05532.1 rab-like GTPase activating protein [Trypanosoma rangeli]|eukprot:RNF05532.1 rab-like GTPase activating protein [Trypanosoma rangeli]